MTKSEFYNQAFLALIPPVTQAYILKHSLPFAESAKDADERLQERSDQMEANAEMTQVLAGKMTAHWKDGNDYYREEDVDGVKEE
jgi:hypothetical protein